MNTNVANVAIDEACDAKQVYNFNVNEHPIIGHILSISFTNGGEELEPDVEVSDPEDPSNKIPIIGAVDHIVWSQKETDPVEIWFRLSANNRGKFEGTLFDKSAGAEIEILLKIYQYDYSKGAQKYYQRFSSKDKIKCILTKGVKNWSVDSSPDQSIQQPPNFRAFLSLTAKTEGEAQQWEIASSTTIKRAFDFGVKSLV